MKIYINKNRLRSAARAFTLIELTVMALVGTLIASMSLVLFNTQVTSFQIIRTQDFLIHEAPQITNTLNQVIPRANFFRLYADPANVVTGTSPVITDANTLVLEFSNIANAAQAAEAAENDLAPVQTTRFGVITFDPAGNLRYYNVANLASFNRTATPAGPAGPATPASPSWIISSQVTNVQFFVDQGVLRTQITGSNGSQFTHSSTTQR